MRINRVNVTQCEGVDIYLEFNGAEGMGEVMRLCNAIEDGSVFAPRPRPLNVLTLRPAECARGEQNCDDCRELRCGDQLWPLLRERKFAPINDPNANDQERFDAALLLIERLRNDLDNLRVETAEALQLAADEKRNVSKLLSDCQAEAERLRGELTTAREHAETDAWRRLNGENNKLRDEVSAGKFAVETAARRLRESEALVTQRARDFAEIQARASTWEARARELGWSSAPGAEIEHG